MNIIVSGVPFFNDWDVFKRSLDRVSFPEGSVRFFSCHGGPCDFMSERYAKEHGLDCWCFPVNAFIPREDGIRIRDMEMVSICDGAVLFWDGVSDDIRRLVALLKSCRRRTVVFNFYGEMVEDFVG